MFMILVKLVAIRGTRVGVGAIIVYFIEQRNFCIGAKTLMALDYNNWFYHFSQ